MICAGMPATSRRHWCACLVASGLDHPLNQRGKSSQRQQRPRDRISVGLIGVGPLWEYRYRPAVERLSSRIIITSVYDAVAVRARQVAADLGSEVASGLRALYERTDIQALIVLDPAWYGLFPAELACEYQKPAFLAGSLGQDLSALQSLYERSQERQTLLMTEFSRRYTPSTTRLRELMATKLGQAVRVKIGVQLPRNSQSLGLPGQSTPQDILAGLFDWCQYVTGRTPVSMTSPTASIATSGRRLVEIGFRPDELGNPSCLAQIELWQEHSAKQVVPSHEVLCEKRTCEYRSRRENRLEKWHDWRASGGTPHGGSIRCGCPAGSVFSACCGRVNSSSGCS